MGLTLIAATVCLVLEDHDLDHHTLRAKILSRIRPSTRNRLVLRDTTVDRRSPYSFSDKMVDYYDQTWLDYRCFWLNERTLSVHFGYTNEITDDHADSLLNMNRVLADRVGIRKGERVLDAGCGIGGSSFWLAQQRGAQVVGITPVGSQVALAWRFAARRKLTQDVHFEQVDYTHTRFPNGSFDVVWALESLCHAQDKAAFYREAARLLRPGGRLVVAEYMRTARPFGAPGERLLHKWLDGWAIPDLDTPDEHRSSMSTSGFSDIRIDDVTTHTRPSLHRLYRITRWSYPLAILGRAAGIRSSVQHGNVLGSLHQYQALERGLWFYGIISAVATP
jgi:cyclopropane fatty-acyl-phospholipid synthase-like methyltransferase